MLGSMLALLLACQGAAPPPPESAFPALHASIYEVWALPADRDALWGQLAGAFAGEALTAAYVDHWAAREALATSETSVRVVQVDHTELSALESLGDTARLAASWRVGSVITHRGHSHTRVNQHAAVYTLAWGPEGWRIVDTRLRDLRRVEDPLAQDAETLPAEGAPSAFDLLGERP
jgi:hypothetical protein